MFSSRFVVEEMVAADWEEVLALWQRDLNISIAGILGSQEQFRRIIERNPGLAFVARERSSQRIIATLLGTTDYFNGFIRHVYVIAEFRGLGIIKELRLRVTVNLRKNYGVHTCLAFVFNHNKTVKSLLSSEFWQKKECLSCFSFPEHYLNNDYIQNDEIYYVREMRDSDFDDILDILHNRSEYCLGAASCSYGGYARFLEKNRLMSSVVLEKKERKLSGFLFAGYDGIYGNLWNLVIDCDYDRELILKMLVNFSLDSFIKDDIDCIFALVQGDYFQDFLGWFENWWCLHDNVTVFQGNC